MITTLSILIYSEESEKEYAFIDIHLHWGIEKILHLYRYSFTLYIFSYTSLFLNLYAPSIQAYFWIFQFILYIVFDQHLSHVRDTLNYNESTLTLRPRAAATKNKIRMADNLFIFLIQIKNNPGQALYYRFSFAQLWDKVLLH